MRKADELKGPSCLTNAADDEPLFVLRANDELAPSVVRIWAVCYRAAKQAAGQWDQARETKWREAMGLAVQMEHWRAVVSLHERKEGRPDA